MISSFAQIISFLFNPVLLLVFVPLFLVYKTSDNIITAMAWTGYSMIFLLAITFFVIYGVHKKMFTDLDVSKRTQRPPLFIVSLVLALVYLLGLYFLNGPMILFVVIFGIIIGIFVASLVNLRVKASIHVATASALIVALALVYHGYFLFLMLVIPLIAWARVRINRHTQQETLVGAALGILLSLGIYLLVRMVS